MDDNVKRLSIKDLKIGMYVTREQLADIYDTYIFLDAYGKETLEGEILYIAKKPDSTSERIRQERGGLCVFYQQKRLFNRRFDL